jgi:arylsulfatase A-like enzyme
MACGREKRKVTWYPEMKKHPDIRLLDTFSVMTLGVIALSLVAFGPGFSADGNRPKPNVVLIYIDDLGYGDLGVYGAPDIPTPNIDQLAAEGVLCTTSYITNPPCCPSRCSLLMGQYGQRFGKYGMSRGLPIPEDRPTLAAFLRDHGYVTGQIGKWDIGTRQQGPLQVGFENVSKSPPRKRYTEDELRGLPKVFRKQFGGKGGQSKYFCINEKGETVWLTDYDGDRMVEFIELHEDDPFFLYWSPEAVHSINVEAPDRLKDRTTAPEERRALAGAIVSVDDQVGKLIEVLEEKELRENTLIIFSSDNGANESEGGSSTPYTGGKGQGTQKEGWVRVPTIFSMPGRLPEGKRYEGMIANFDFFSTIAAASGLEIPDHCDGVNLIPFLTGEETGDAHEYLFWLNSEPGDAVRRHLIAVRWKDWRLYRKYADDEWQLFDLRKDPCEENNIAAQNPEVVRQMAKRHAAWERTLVPVAEIPVLKGQAEVVPKGHGWATASTGK